MRIFKNNKKSGFTLMEIAIAVMIVGLLTAIVIPIVRNQMSKLDEYSYYTAYKTVEKLGGQIVALGLDPNVPDVASNDEIKFANGNNNLNLNLGNKNLKLWFESLGSKFVYSEQYLFKKLFPKSYAGNDWEVAFEWTDDDYQEANLRYRMCNGEKIYVKTDSEGNQIKDASGNPVYETAESFFGSGACDGYTKGTASSGDDTVAAGPNSAMTMFYNSQYCATTNSDGSSKQTTINNDLAAYVKQKTNANNAQAFCTGKIVPMCKKDEVPSGQQGLHYNYRWIQTSEGGVDDEGQVEAPTYSCQILVKDDRQDENGYNGNDANWTRQPVASNVCSSVYGYYNMVNEGAPYSINCQCQSGYDVSENNDKVCCQRLSKSTLRQFANSSNACVACDNADFNTGLNQCCPKYSKYDGTNCKCINGYRTDPRSGTYSDGSPKACQIATCVGGSHLETDEFGNTSCVANSPILKARDLCKSINYFWNVQPNRTSCSFTNTGSNGLAVYQAVYDAAKGTNGRYLSVQSQEGAFNNIAPNIVLANGLRLWILGDKTATIPGLSYNPTSITSNTQNMCIDLGKNTKASCDAVGGYFCKSENHCFKLDNLGMTNLGDARNCCASTDLSSLAAGDPVNFEKDNRAFAISGFTVFVDINGPKGSSTLWEDVFPFYIGANGVVYPGYPLDAIKAQDGGSSLYIAGNGVQDLSVDVYYYEAQNNFRRKVMAYPNVSYARGACFAKKVKAYTPYCQNLGESFKMDCTDIPNCGNDPSQKIKNAINDSSNPCNSHFCLLSVRKKTRFF